MACCVFAAMIITNVLLYYRKIKQLLGFRVDPYADQWQKRPAPSPLLRWLKIILPLVLVSSTVIYGSLHWHHISPWSPSINCDQTERSNECHQPHH